MRATAFFLFAFLLSAGAAFADRVTTRDGAVLVGTIKVIDAGKITLETAYAGTLTIDAAQVVSFATDNPIFVRLQSGNVMSGQVVATPDHAMSIKNADGTMTTSIDKVASSWSPAAKDPEVVRREAEVEALSRHWKYQIGTRISGSGGNTKKAAFGLQGSATLQGPQDTLVFYGRVDSESNNDVQTAEEYLGGVRYDSFLYKNVGWYTRAEFEKDEFEGIDFRSTAAGGATYRFLNEDKHKLVGRAGLGYRYQSFLDGTSSEDPSLDISFSHSYTAKVWKIDSEISYNPSFNDFGDFLLKHSSIATFPVANSFWNIGLGLNNDYISEPPAGLDSWNYTWYAALLLNFD